MIIVAFISRLFIDIILVAKIISIVNKIAEGHKKGLKSKKLATFVSSYVKKLSKGISR